MTLPEVPPASTIDPLIEEIPVGTTLVRISHRRWGAAGFNPSTGSARFRPVHDGAANVVATAYLASDDETALAEALLRGVSALERGERPHRLYRVETMGLDLSRMRVARRLRVARLHGLGLNRLGLRRSHVIDCPERDYPYTARWAQALWGCRSRPYGIAWTSRQNDSGRAYVLWRDRVSDGDLEPTGSRLSLDRGLGLEAVREACAAAGVDFDG